MSKPLAIAASLIALATLGRSTSVQAETENRLRIGIVLPLSGGLEPAGRDMLQGMELALKEFQHREPQKAKMITVIKGDDQGSLERASEAVEKLYRVRKAHVVIGSLPTHVNTRLAGIARAEKKPIVFPASLDPALGEQNPYVFQTAIGWDRQGQNLARFAARFLKKQKALLIYDDASVFAKMVATNFKDAFTRDGGAVVGELAWDPARQDAAALAKAAVAAKADVVLYPGFFPEAAKTVAALRQAGLKAPILGTDGWDSPYLQDAATADVMKGNYYVAQFSARDPSPQARLFSQRFQEASGRPAGAFAAMGFDAMALVLESFAQNRSGTVESLVEGMGRARQVPVANGTADMAENHQLAKPGTMMFTQKQGAQFITRY